MAVFAVIGLQNPPAIKAAVVEQYGANHYEFAPNVWFVVDGGTTKDVGDKLRIMGGKSGTGVILRFDAYAGRGPKDAWDWLQKNSDAIVHG